VDYLRMIAGHVKMNKESLDKKINLILIEIIDNYQKMKDYNELMD
jgi:hypothetical protein